MAGNTLFKEYNSADYVKFAEQTASWIKTTGSLGKYGRLWNQSPDSKEDFTDYPMLTPKSLYGGSILKKQSLPPKKSSKVTKEQTFTNAR